MRCATSPDGFAVRHCLCARRRADARAGRGSSPGPSLGDCSGSPSQAGADQFVSPVQARSRARLGIPVSSPTSPRPGSLPMARGGPLARGLVLCAVLVLGEGRAGGLGASCARCQGVTADCVSGAHGIALAGGAARHRQPLARL